MASLTLYPPIVESSIPAFIVKEDAVCRVYFSLSQFNTRNHFKNVQVSIVKQDSGLSVVNRIDGLHYRATGIILNVPVHSTEQYNLYYIEIMNEDIGYQNIQGWTAGWLYKIQLRLSNAEYTGAETQAVWLNNNTQHFSEWSTITLVKAIGDIHIQIPVLSFDNQIKDENVDSASLAISTLDIHGTYACEDKSENLKAYSFELYEDNELVESSGLLYTNQYINSNEFAYLFKKDLADSKDLPYLLKFYYITTNDYEAIEEIKFTVLQALIGETNITLRIYSDAETENSITATTTIALEEDEGRVGIKLFDQSGKPYSGNLCIRRTDHRSNFSIWEDIAVIVMKNQNVADYPIIYDYTIESGVIYKYGSQLINTDGSRSSLLVTDKEIIRSFEYSYLLGENNQQLKLMFNNNINNVKPVRNDAKIDTIGSAYPFITRNGATKYKTFPITGLISFNMDNNFLAIPFGAPIQHQHPVEQVNELGEVISIEQPMFQDLSFNTFLPIDFFKGREGDMYTKERVFREAVLDFLLDGKPKLFKSPTEGNVIVRLTDINCTPEQALGRLIYSFSATAYEIAEPTMVNYLKYKFYKLNNYETDFSTVTYKIGQLQQTFSTTEDICKLIKDKYSIVTSVANHMLEVTKIIGLKITIEDKPLRIKNNANEIVLGNNIKLNDTILTIYHTTRIYEFGKEIYLTPEDKLFLLGDADNIVNTVNATIDFIYELTTSKASSKEIATTKVFKGVGQLYKTFSNGESIYSDLYYKYYIEWEQEYRRLNRLWMVEIEAFPGAVFGIKDFFDTNPQIHEINSTGILRLSELSNIQDIVYLGKRTDDNNIDETIRADININYWYYILKGTYK